MSAIDRINYINILLMLLSCVLAFAFPYGLLVFSYAVLGPAHYLTQISWLHDRQYFTPHKYVFLVFSLLTIGMVALSGQITNFLLIFSLLTGLVMALPLEKKIYLPLLAGCATLALVITNYTPMALFLVILVPTILHVFAFTFNFILVGSLKEKSLTGFLSLIVMPGCAMSFLFWTPTMETTHALHPGVLFFRSVTDYLHYVFSVQMNDETITQMFGFLSFAYTYHYLNWFSKTRVIRWHEIPKRRFILIIALYILSLAVYAYDYVTGFYVLLFLSILHVLLEFPLNWRTLGMIWTLAMPSFIRK